MKSQGLHNISIVVVGAGASGLMAAIGAARLGARVLVIEQKEKAGKKLLATGNGRCNFSNRRMDASCYHENLFALSVIGQFDVDRTLAFFQELGIFPHERDGYYYPASEQAASVVNLLVREAKRLGVSVLTDTKVEKIRRLKNGFESRSEGRSEAGKKKWQQKEPTSGFLLSVTTAVKNNVRETVKKNGKKKVTAGEIRYESRQISADRVILACGGKASPVLGSDGSGYELAGALGHQVIRPLPALTGIQCRETWFKQLAGVRISARVTILADGKPLAYSDGELQLTDYGISGIPVFQVSRHAAKAIADGKRVQAELCFFPEIPEAELIAYLGSHTPEQYGGLYPEKLLAVLMQLARFSENGEKADRQMYELTRKLRCTCREVNGFDRAQVTCGGISLEQVSPDTLESLLCPGLYFSGELLDVDGICGGYNLQWAWSSGWVAGQSAAKYGYKELECEG